LDTDGDGVDDAEDGCPAEPGVPAGSNRALAGCPAPQLCLSIALESTIQITARIYFDRNQATVPERSKNVLDDVATVLREQPKMIVELLGHQEASERADIAAARAHAVLEYLVSKGVDRANLKTTRAALDPPAADGGVTDPDEIRRVSFRIVGR